MMSHDAQHLLVQQNGNDGMPNSSMPILQPVFISRTAMPTGGGLAHTQSYTAGSSSNETPDLAAAHMHSSPSLLLSPMGARPNSQFFSDNFAVGHDTLAQAAATDPNGLVMLSNGNNLAQYAPAMYHGDNAGVQTLHSSRDQLTVAANAQAAAAQQTQALLQQQAAAVNSLSAGLGSMNLAGLTAGLGNGLGQLEESLSGSLFGAAAASGLPKPVSSSLYIKNLPPDADKLFLYEKFAPYGAILSVKVLNDPQSGQCRGVGFVNFAEHASALRSIQALHGTKVGDKLMHVSLQTPRLRASATQF